MGTVTHSVVTPGAGPDRDQLEIDRTLHEITTRAAANAAGDVGVGLSVVVRGGVQSVGATTTAAQSMEAGQSDDGPSLQALRSGHNVSVTDYTLDLRWPVISQRASVVGVRSSLSMPLTTREGTVLGTLNIYSDTVDAFDAETRSHLRAFAAQATTSLFFLGKLQAERQSSAYLSSFSRVVQTSLHSVLPDVPGIELVGGTVPSAAHASVGGDWYDALVLRDGSLGIVIGDVMGHDVQAISAMAQMRTMVRSGAWLGQSPAEVMAMTDQLADLVGIAETATLFYGRLVGTGAHARLAYCNAGHLHPFLRRADGTVEVLDDGTRILIGALAAGPVLPDTVTAHVAIPSGSVLLLYTDGLVERGDMGVDEATAELRRKLAEYDPATSLAEFCAGLLTAHVARDDATVFALANR